MCDGKLMGTFTQILQMIEEQIKARDLVATGTNFAVQDLSNKHLQGVGDLRGRVARWEGETAN